MRTLEIGTRKYTEVRVLDEKGQGNANHVYKVYKAGEDADGLSDGLCLINFQNGPIKEFGVNGVTNEDLIAIVIDRLAGFQTGEYACPNNYFAMGKLEEALMWLRHRTNNRETRGVEGTNVI